MKSIKFIWTLDLMRSKYCLVFIELRLFIGLDLLRSILSFFTALLIILESNIPSSTRAHLKLQKQYSQH